MSENRPAVTGLAIIAFLSGVILTGVAVTVARCTPSPEIVITNENHPEWESTVVISGAVNFPGRYPCRHEDSLASLIEAAGGITDNVRTVEPVLCLDFPDTVEQPQRIDINHAEPWLLKALPGIGDALAARIIEYRSVNGPFDTVYELKLVEGIGSATFTTIEPYITVSDPR